MVIAISTLPDPRRNWKDGFPVSHLVPTGGPRNFPNRSSFFVQVWKILGNWIFLLSFAFNEEVLLPQTLSHLIECFSEIPQYAGEIIVVDNNSSDRTGEIARAVGQVRVVWEPVRSISKARNRGASEALGELLSLMMRIAWFLYLP